MSQHFKKDITWQGREFDFDGEQILSFDSKLVSTISSYVTIYPSLNQSKVKIVFTGDHMDTIGELVSHKYDEDAKISSN